jgi:glyoxylase-like metal-dependent hydrolase (beta-lactamase superfamily II)
MTPPTSIALGDAVVHPIRDGHIRLDLSHCYPDVPAAAWLNYADIVDLDGADIIYELGGFLITTPGRRVLVDCGMRSTSSGQAGLLLSSLYEVGVQPSDITDVVISHLHADHIGWASVDGAAVFPNAIYHCHEADWAYFCEEGGPIAYPGLPEAERGPRLARIRSLVLPIEERFLAWSGAVQLGPDVALRHTPGHTPGSSICVVGHGHDALYILGDVVHSAAELSHPEWCFVLDANPTAASETRATLADEIASAGALVTAPHFPRLSAGRLGDTTGGGLRFTPEA